MKVLFNGNQELATIDFDVDAETGMCNPKIDTLGYHIEGPKGIAALVKDEETDGLRLKLVMPDVAEAAIVIEKEDVKRLKRLMNKEAIKFMVKALL